VTLLICITEALHFLQSAMSNCQMVGANPQVSQPFAALLCAGLQQQQPQQKQQQQQKLIQEVLVVK